MLSTRSSQTNMKGYALRPYEDRWPANSWDETPRTDALPSFLRAARGLLSHRERSSRQTPQVEHVVA